ncbi:MAG: signal recognition particle protein [bacterium]|nr:signal recognition particle protein [bacterium]
MSFENLTSKFQVIFKKLRRKGRLNPKDIQEACRDIKLALLQADVNFRVVKEIIANISKKAEGKEVMQSLTPGQQVIKIVKSELTRIMEGGESDLNLSPFPPTIIMLVGLYGCGKTTTCAKLGYYLKQKGHSSMLVAADPYRPAASEQLKILGKRIDIPVYTGSEEGSPVDIVKSSKILAEKEMYDFLLIDTSGRLHIDEGLMEELRLMKEEISPNEVLLVVDAMTGQEAVNIAKTFNEKLDISGVILTKLDSDARGGAGLSINMVIGKPIKFVGVGEGLSDLSRFYPERMASRIIGMGDVFSLIEKVEKAIDEKKARELEYRLKKERFDLEDFLDQLKVIKKIGSFDQILSMIPGLPKTGKEEVDKKEKEMVKIEAIINSMTREERRNPEIISGSRKKRVAYGSGTTLQDVNRVLRQFNQLKMMMKNINKFSKKDLPFQI